MEKIWTQDCQEYLSSKEQRLFLKSSLLAWIVLIPATPPAAGFQGRLPERKKKCVCVHTREGRLTEWTLTKMAATKMRRDALFTFVTVGMIIAGVDYGRGMTEVEKALAKRKGNIIPDSEITSFYTKRSSDGGIAS